MLYYCAPMEGITGAPFRRIHHQFFPGVDKYFTPFLSPSQDRCFTKRDKREILPQYNEGIPVVPQLLTRRSEDFIWAAKALADMGYREINLNLGCPSGTVTAKGKGAGFLAFPDALDAFLEDIFSHTPIPISIKTRLGVSDPAEFDRLLAIYNRYPASELIIHPRVRRDFYRPPLRSGIFDACQSRAAAPLCYNGDLVTAEDCGLFTRTHPLTERVMLGRGLIADPALISRCRGGTRADKPTLHAYLDALYREYAACFGSEHAAMLRMKEIWYYQIHLFRDGARHGKELRKARQACDYERCVTSVFQDLELREAPDPVWLEG